MSEGLYELARERLTQWRAPGYPGSLLVDLVHKLDNYNASGALGGFPNENDLARNEACG